ncbi:hypothetical protein MMC29_004550 [Sticta canariensis]|nr:hypothetical protein [Sticta canariensis]
MSTYSEYGKDVVPPIPLFFDRVNEGRPPNSNSFLFQLPFEVLGVITRYLSESSLASLSLHLKLCRVNISEEFGIALPQALAHRGWPLCTLHLEIYWGFFDGPRGRTAPLCTSILHLCAPTLEKLVWTAVTDPREDLQSLVTEEPPRFVKLRELTLRRIKFLDHSTLKLLIFPQSESRLKALDVDAGNRSLVAQFLEGCGTIRSLETFVGDACCLAPDQPFTFLRNNAQLSKLRLPFPQTPAVLDEGILPILSQSFQELKSLSLTGEGTSISISALGLIGTLRGLQQLHLSAGFQAGWRHDWLIKHREMREYLKELRDLKKLAFSRDTYEGRWGFEEAYYSDRDPISEEIPEDLQGPDNVWKSKQIWERQHRQRILAEADDYIRVLPRLEWVYFGKIPMGVIDAENGQGRQAVVLSEDRDDGYTLLERMFGRETCDD